MPIDQKLQNQQKTSFSSGSKRRKRRQNARTISNTSAKRRRPDLKKPSTSQSPKTATELPQRSPWAPTERQSLWVTTGYPSPPPRATAYLRAPFYRPLGTPSMGSGWGEGSGRPGPRTPAWMASSSMLTMSQSTEPAGKIMEGKAVFLNLLKPIPVKFWRNGRVCLNML